VVIVARKTHNVEISQPDGDAGAVADGRESIVLVGNETKGANAQGRIT
jgi:hypothetical protein